MLVDQELYEIEKNYADNSFFGECIKSGNSPG